MREIQVIVNDEVGLHARPASSFVKSAGKFKSEISVLKKDKMVNGKSMIGVLSLGAKKGDLLNLRVEGEDESEVVEFLQNFFERQKYC